MEANNAVLAARYLAIQEGGVLSNFTSAVPKICMNAYLLRKVINPEADPSHSNATIFRQWDAVRRNQSLPRIVNAEIQSGALQTLNTTELYEFMVSCGKTSKSLATQLRTQSTEAALDNWGSLSFGWIRCFEGASGIDDPNLWQTRDNGWDFDSNATERRYPAQAAYFEQTWRADMELLRQEQLDEAMDTPLYKINPWLVHKRAQDYALEHATGESGCGYNVPAASWFWFTVMTTIGYGNQAPYSTGGRAMTFTWGLVSFFLFGAILAQAGGIMAAILEDALIRWNKQRHLSQQWRACVIWGILYYMWMNVIAGFVYAWKLVRLGEDAMADNTYRDMYWFAFISTTTVGLGDIYLEPEVIISVDLAFFPILFLVGFSFFSAFLSQLVEALYNFWKRYNRRNKDAFYKTFLSQLKSVDDEPDNDST